MPADRLTSSVASPAGFRSLPGRFPAWLAAALLLPAAPPCASALVPDPGRMVEMQSISLSWARNLDSALQAGLTDYKPVLAVFSAPNCPWCTRLKNELASPALRPLLDSFVLVEIDASSSPVAQRHGIRSVPTVLVFSGDGRVRGGFQGYLPAPDLKSALGPFVQFDSTAGRSDLETEERFSRLATGTLQDDDWPAFLRMLGNPSRRDDLRQSLLSLDPFPADILVAHLASPELAVRMGAIELLEERTGNNQGYDPWLPPRDPAAAPFLQRWQDWADDEDARAAAADARYAPLTDERIAAYIQDILGEDRERTVRAMQMLEGGGHHAALQLAEFVRDHPGLAPGLRRRLREVQYAILLHGTSGHEASATAHQIVFGNLDTRLRTVAALPQTGAGLRAIPILQDLLVDENPLLREAACESILAIAGGAGTALLSPFLKTEPDPNVVFSTLRALGNTRNPRAVIALLPFLESENEDLVIIALESLSKLKYTAISKQLAACLLDPRWRVRVAALDTIAELELKNLRPEVEQTIDDPDAFVRNAAIRALAAVSLPSQFTDSAADLFRDVPDQRAMVLKAMASHDLEIPGAFIETIVGDDHPERIVACLGAAADLDEKAVDLANRLANHVHPDVAAAALAILVDSGVKNAVSRRHIIQAFRTRTGRDLAALVEDLSIPSQAFEPYAIQYRHWLQPDLTAPAPEPSVPLLAILEAFSRASRAPPQPAPPPPRPTSPSIDELVDAFAPRAPTESGGTVVAPASLPDLIREIEVLATNADSRVAFYASLHLVRLGHAGLVPVLAADQSTHTQSERLQITYALDSITSPDAMALNIALLSDSSEQVRSRAAGNLIDNFGTNGFVALVDELLRPETLLHPSELSLRYRTSRLSPRQVRRQGRRLLASGRPPLEAMGILLIGHAWKPDDVDLLEPYIRSDNPYLRGAAYWVVGRRNPGAFRRFLPDAVQDPSPIARSAVAQVFMQDASVDSFPLSKDESLDFSFDRNTPSRTGRLDEAFRSALHTLARDPHPPVRFRALLTLLSRGETIDVSQLAAALDSLPDSRRAATELLQVLSPYGNANPRPELAVLGASLRRQLNDSYWQRQIDQLVGPGITEDDLLAVNILTRFDAPRAPVELALPPAESQPAVSNPPPTLVYFYQPGCRECRDVRSLLDSMPRYFDGLRIVAYNVRQRRAALLNEALCDRFGIPGNARLIAPSLFAADGALIGEAITFDALADLLSRSASREDGLWFAPDQPLLDQAGQSIQNRYVETVKTGLVALIALADGINPCAFATMIFLLSYLQIARRDPRQIRQVGTAFILGVFLAYFAMGLGLVTLLDRLAFLEPLSRVVNFVMAAVVLLIAFLSIRDGFLCLRGRMADMTLQLPAPLKQQIHAVVRHGARHRRFLAASFVIGMLIAVIELPCTGQAYLPTIAYMVRDAALRPHALFHLVLYNVLFVLPLVAIFLLASCGLTHERLSAFLYRHAATVKFTTAALFLALFAVFWFAL